MANVVISPDKYREIYASMYYTRQVEKKLWDLRMLPAHESPVPSVILNSWWEWSIGAAVGAALDPTVDYLVPGHRTTAAFVNFFRRCNRNFAIEYFRNHLGTANSVTQGWSLNVHYAFPELHIFPFHSDMAGNAPAAAGIGLALKRLKAFGKTAADKQGVVAVFWGEGAFNQGLAHEGLSLIGTLNLPVIVVINKNQWSTYTPYDEEAAIDDLSDKALGYGLAKLEVRPGYDTIFLYRKICELVERARKQTNEAKSLYDTKAGALVVIEVERGATHNVQMDPRHSFKNQNYSQVYAESLAREPVKFMKRQLLMMPKLKAVQAQGDLRKVAELKGEDMEFNRKAIRALETEINKEVETALQQVLTEPKSDHITCDHQTFKPSNFVVSFTRCTKREIEPLDCYLRGRLNREDATSKGWTTKFVDAHRFVFDKEFERNPLLYAWGEDFGEGDVYGQWRCFPPDSRTLQEKYGKERIFNSILAEGAIYGSAEGAAFAGLRPVIGVQYLQFGWASSSVLISGMAPRPQISNMFLPMTIIMPSGEGIVSGHHHAALHLKTLLYHLQMIKVVEPTTVRDLAGLLRASLKDNSPVVIIEGISAYENVIGKMPMDEDFVIPIGKAALRQEGTDLTILSWGAWINWQVVEPALKTLSKKDLSIEWIDARTLVPMDYSLVFDSVLKTRRLVIVHAETLTGGIGESVAAKIMSEPDLQNLSVKIKILAARDGATPQAPALEKAHLPSAEKLIEACYKITAKEAQS